MYKKNIRVSHTVNKSSFDSIQLAYLLAINVFALKTDCTASQWPRLFQQLCECWIKV